MWYSTSSGRIELQISKAQAARGYHSGRCDDDIEALRREPAIRRQLDKISPALLADELREWGAWSDQELSDHADNQARLLWLACGDIIDNT
jgi:hypothetical protein